MSSVPALPSSPSSEAEQKWHKLKKQHAKRPLWQAELQARMH